VSTQYQFDPARSRFTVQAFSGGLLSFLGHNPLFEVRDYGGSVSFQDDMIANMKLELAIRTGSLMVANSLVSDEGQVIEGSMRHDVLETEEFPLILFIAAASSSERIARGHYRVKLEGSLELHGIAHTHPTTVELMVFEDGIRVKGDTGVRMSEYRIQPVTGMAGAIRMKDEVVLSFDLGARPEAS
jgi:polyisoprenoid-binding protein YceI